MNYRADIDGLRAVSVLVILLFHVGFTELSGGFVGVDVFFVISGYLITRNIIKRREAGSFKFSDFYVSRVRRLWPALAVTLAATLAASFFVLSPEHLAQLGRSTAAALVSISNVLFWVEVGYFDLDAHMKPLLHTWSLGVEEQFYLFWPAISVFFLKPLGRWLRVALLFIIVLGGAAAAELYLRVDPSGAFYLTPFRIGEFALGGLVWVSRITLPRWFAEIACAVGYALIAYSVFAFDHTTPFPGLNALIPCLGGALLISGGQSSVLGGLLRFGPAVWIGKISYSLYLVHWPIVVLAAYTGGTDWSFLEKLGLALLSIIAATLLHEIVETPFRKPAPKGRFGSRAFAATAISAAICVTTVSAAAWTSNGWPSRLAGTLAEAAIPLATEKAQHFELSKKSRAEPFPSEAGAQGLIIGDSHGAGLLNALTMANTNVHFRHKNLRLFCAIRPGEQVFPPENKFRTAQDAQQCTQQNAEIFADQDLEHSDIIIFASAWLNFDEDGFRQTIHSIRERSNAKIFVVGPRYFFTDPGQILATAQTASDANESFSTFAKMQDDQVDTNKLRSVAESVEATFIDPRPLLCGRGTQEPECPLLNDLNEVTQPRNFRP